MAAIVRVIDGDNYIAIDYIQKADDDRFLRLGQSYLHHSPKDYRHSIQALALVKTSEHIKTIG